MRERLLYMRYYFAVAPMLVLLAVGCSGGTVGPKIKGQVLLDGAPVSRARVNFEAKGIGTTATTDAEGKFFLDGTMFKTLKPGKYIVRIAKHVDKKTGEVPTEDELGQLRASDGLKNVLPEKYDAREENPLVVEIKDGLNELPPFQLKQ